MTTHLHYSAANLNEFSEHHKAVKFCLKATPYTGDESGQWVIVHPKAKQTETGWECPVCTARAAGE